MSIPLVNAEQNRAPMNLQVAGNLAGCVSFQPHEDPLNGREPREVLCPSVPGVGEPGASGKFPCTFGK